MTANRFKTFVFENTVKDRTSQYYNFQKDSEEMGTKAITTRQPPRIHAMLEMMSEIMPSVKKAEIIYESMVMAFEKFEEDLKTTRPEMFEVVDEYMVGADEYEQVTHFDVKFGNYLNRLNREFSVGEISSVSQDFELEIQEESSK